MTLTNNPKTDRAAIGNASIAGFPEDIGLVDNQFGIAVSIFYVTYIVFEPFAAVLMKIVSPKIMMTGSTFIWASVTIGMAFVRNYSQLIALRLLLGVAEAAVLPCIGMYTTMVYNRNEYAVRKSYLQVSGAASGAFGGLLAFGLTQINHHSLRGWQWLFLIEGILSMCLVPFAWFWLPNQMTGAIWLKPEEKEFMERRRLRNTGVYDEKEKFRWSEVIRCLKDWKLWVSSVIHFGSNTTLFAVTTFMPRIIAGLNITTGTNSQLLTVPVYFLAGATTFVVARIADRKRQTSRVINFGQICIAIGYILLLSISHPGGRFFGLFVLGMGMYTSGSMNIVWCQTMHAPYYKRAVATSMMQVIGNVSGAIIGFIFTTQSGPRYMMGMGTALGLITLSFCLSVFLSFMLMRENKRREKLVAEGAEDQPHLGDRNPHFRYFT